MEEKVNKELENLSNKGPSSPHKSFTDGGAHKAKTLMERARKQHATPLHRFKTKHRGLASCPRVQNLCM